MRTIPTLDTRCRVTPIASAGVVKLLILALLIYATGCQSLPETGVKSFADATATLKTTLKTAGKSAVQDVGQIHTDDSASKAEAEAMSAALSKAWASRDKTFEALDRYAASLSSLVDAGKSGQANATAFVSAVQGLVDAAGSVTPGGPAAAAAAKPILQGVELIYGKIAEQIAAGKIEEAVNQADPIVAAVADLVAQDLINLREIAVQEHTTAVNQLRGHSDIVPTLNSLSTALKNTSVKAFGNPPDAASLDLLKKLNEAATAINIDPAYLEYKSKLDALDATFQSQTDLLDQASLTLGAWAEGHHDIVIGLQQKSAPSLQELTQFTEDLYTIYKDYRTARSKAHS